MNVEMKCPRIPSWLLIVLSGIFLGLSAPGRSTQLFGLAAFFPLFIVLDRFVYESDLRCVKKCFLAFLCCWLMGMVSAPIGVNWMTQCLRSFGGQPVWTSYAITSLLYGLEVGYLVFVSAALPVLFIRRRGIWDLLVRLAFFLAVEPLLPQLFPWSFGGMTLSAIPLIEQTADVIGTAGLDIFNVGFSLMLLLSWRRKRHPDLISARILRNATIVYLLLWFAGFAYGFLRVQSLQPKVRQGAKLDIALIQPNFSNDYLIKRTHLTFQEEMQMTRELIAQSKKALRRLRPDGRPRLVIWPESAFRKDYFKREQPRKLVKDFAVLNRVYVVLTTVDWEYNDVDRRSNFELSLLVGPDGAVRSKYYKVYLIPFGEYNPLVQWFGPGARALKKVIRNMSEYDHGSEYTVFPVSDGITLAAPICFDAFSESIARNMVNNGANVVVNLSNLAWFGKSLASEHMAMSLRWKAIEYRAPMVLAANTGKSMLFDALGRRDPEVLGMFTKGAIVKTVTVNRFPSFYRDHRGLVRLGYVLILILFGILGQLREKTFTRASGGPSPEES